MMKTIALGISPLLLAGCASLGSTGDKEAADTFWENAWSYYEGRDYPRSMNQIERGLAEDPEHYLLNLLQGYDGTPRIVTATTVPAGLTVDITYDGSATAPRPAWWRPRRGPGASSRASAWR